MKVGSFDTDRGVLVVAEIGNNHEGDFKRAAEMVRQAAGCGVASRQVSNRAGRPTGPPSRDGPVRAAERV